MDSSGRTKVTPPQLARRWGVAPEKVVAWIRAGELRAMDASTCRGGRPRYLIDETDVLLFEKSRAVVVRDNSQGQRRRQKSDADIIEFF